MKEGERGRAERVATARRRRQLIERERERERVCERERGVRERDGVRESGPRCNNKVRTTAGREKEGVCVCVCV